MKRFSQALALVAVTTLFATAFTTSTLDQHVDAYSALTRPQTKVAQVVVVGKRMTDAEKLRYDIEFAQTAGPVIKQNRTLIAVK
ncbi:hypothetical protein [Sapientia aquatica]|uniref:DUF4148 domain-containing protein n=1 Tax=Sapientia aquatica TaxID=1549640 RepID=A0A4R5W7N4_9BURK|nr:hypothetical protein [Sapientia aquatica]TDK68474.1 hypothetical protein E2I14_02730 [Sapientia aquatica]